MIPRAMEQIFRSSADLQAQGWSFSMQASMMEIHNEEYKDLLGKGLPAGKFHKVSRASTRPECLSPRLARPQGA